VGGQPLRVVSIDAISRPEETNAIRQHQVLGLGLSGGRLLHPLEGSGFDFLPGKRRRSGPSKTARDRAPATSTPSQRPDHPPCSDFNFLGQIDPHAGRVPEGRQIVAHRGIGGQT
jgi:hypothetical protein